MAESTTRRVAQFWDENVWTQVPNNYWTSNPIINEYVNFQIIEPRSEDSHVSWWLKKYLNHPCQELLSLGCGAGFPERVAVKSGIAQRACGYDISENALRLAREAARNEEVGDRITYRICNLNQGVLPIRRFDAIISFGCLHHIHNLESLYSAIDKALTVDGVFFMNEYAGPARFQYSNSLLHEVNRVVKALPSNALLKDELNRPKADAIAEADPSEACRSDEIVPLLSKYFDVIDGRNYGGGLLFPLWAEIIDPAFFVREDPEVITLLGELCLLDYQLTVSGRIENLFVQYVLCPKEQRRGRSAFYSSDEAIDTFLEFVKNLQVKCIDDGLPSSAS